ncbi:hypothetical protein TNCT_406281 [Trichonephila clavata]|uniref:Uncharacterized protein n=1 Tax=Trichonephila clavata TaxID=2740835 RepID=A0A8X6KQU8_TRICU|nr:hypothetical protein TNCT_406281 [Trichonephila clavata]
MCEHLQCTESYGEYGEFSKGTWAHRQFRDMFKDKDTDSQDLQYYTAVRWLSFKKLLSRVFELRKETDNLLKSKSKPRRLLSDEE